jgi:hypothetical protein
MVDPAFGGYQTPFQGILGLQGSAGGSPAFAIQRLGGGQTNQPWWLGTQEVVGNTLNAAAGSNYNTGLYPLTATGGGCIRPPSAVWLGSGATVQVTDPGLGCATPPTINFASVPTSGAQQATGYASAATTCVSNSPVSGEMTVTAHLQYAHGITPGMTYTMQGFTAQTGYNATYTAINGTTSTTLVGETTTGAGTCPTSPATVEGSALSGTGAVLTFPTPSQTIPFGANASSTVGITTKPGQHICGIVSEDGDDAFSPFPGAQIISMVDDKGNALPGAPAVMPVPNQGDANFTGYTVVNTQSPTFFNATFASGTMTTTTSQTLATGQLIAGPGIPAGTTVTTGATGTSFSISNSSITITPAETVTANYPALFVTAMNPYTISAGSYSGTTGYVTFTTSSAPGFVAGSEFTVSGLTNTGSTVNQTYVVVNPSGLSMSALQAATTIVGNPLSGPGGTPRPFATAPSGISAPGGSQMVSVIMPGMTVLGVTGGSSNASIIAPYGTNGTTGVGGVGNYALTSNQTSGATFTVSAASSLQITVTGTPSVPIVVGTNFTLNSNSYVIASLGTGTGAAGTYNVASGSPAAGTATMTGALGSSGTPVNLFAYTPYYFNTPAAASTAPSGGVVTARAASYFSDFMGTFGGANTSVSGNVKTGWGGSLSNVAMLYGVFPQVSGIPSMTALANLCKKTPGYDLHSFAAANSLTVHSLYELNDLGVWGDSSYADFTGSISGTALTVALTPYGALPTVTAGSPSITISGAGIAGCPSTCPTIASGSGGSYVLSASGGTVSSEPMKAGLYKPAKPIASQNFQGSIAGSTLSVTSLDPSGNAGFSSFSGTLGTAFTGYISGNTLTLTLPVVTLSSAPQSPAVIGVGTQVCPPVSNPTEFTCATVTALGTGAGGSGTYTLSSSQTVGSSGSPIAMYGSGILPGPPTVLQTSGTVVGTPSAGMFVADATAGTFLTGSPLLVTFVAGTTPNFVLTVQGNYYPASTSATSMIASLSTIIPGEYIQNAGITTPVKILGYQPTSACTTAISGAFNGGLGCYTLSTSANGTIASSAFTGTTITDGGAIGPGPALTIRDEGPGVIFPVNHATNTGTLWLSGTYDTSLIGGTPSTIQAQVSQTANGSPVSGCSACAWANLSSYAVTPYTFSASITTGGAMTVPLSSDQPAVGNAFSGAGYSGTVTASAGLGSFTVSPSPGSAIALETMTASTVHRWAGQAASIPGGGPYYVSVQAANGAGYATLPNSIKVGDVFALWGEGQADGALSTQGGTSVSWFQNLWGLDTWISQQSGDKVYLTGPPVAGTYAPSHSTNYAGDRYGITSSGSPLPEAGAAFDQTLVNAFGFPASIIRATHNGVGAIMDTMGGAAQSQTVGLGDGSTLDWCSATKFCASSGVSAGGPFFFNAASLTGATLTGASIAPGTGVNAGLGVLSVPASSGVSQGALEPGMVLSDTTGDITGAPTLVRCISGCSATAYVAGAFTAQSWAISVSQTVSETTMRADPPGGAPWPNFVIAQVDGVPFAFTGYGWEMVKAGTLSITVNGTVACSDMQTFVYNNTGGNCTPPSGNPLNVDVANSFVNYQTGDYQIAFLSGHAPASGAVISASWTSSLSPENVASAQYSRPQNLDFFGDGTCQSGADSSLFCKTPGGVSGHIFASLGGTDKGYILAQGAAINGGYQFGAVGYSQMVSWLYGTRFPALVPGASPSVAYIATGQWRVEGPTYVFGAGYAWDGLYDQWAQDSATPSTFSGTIASGKLTLGSSAAVGQMWEGEVLAGAGVPTGIYITALDPTSSSGWGAAGSIYDLGGASGVTIGSATAMHNALVYSGAGQAIYGGSLYDIIDQTTGLVSTGINPHPNNGFAGGRRATSRWAATIWGATNGTVNASVPTLDRSKTDAGGCDTSANASPCFDDGNTYAASHAATWTTGGLFTVSGGLSAHARPFVVGQLVNCSPACGSNLVITSVSLPPTQDARTGQGQVGQTFTFQTAPNTGGSLPASATSGTATAGCSGTPGTGNGSNCIDIAISVNDNGTFGTAAAIATCGANNLNGNSPGYIIPYGKCQDNGSGEILRTIRIGTTQLMSGNTAVLQPGSVFDDGADMSGGGFNQSAAFTCNIVKATAPGVVQCVKGPAYSSGIFSSVGKWTLGSTFVNYGSVAITGRGNSLLGYVGGQSFPITSGGSGYANQTVTAACSTVASGPTYPKFDIWTSGGVIVNVQPSTVANAQGFGLGSTCTITPTGGTGASIPTIAYGPVEGVGGVATYNTDSNEMGTFIYDNSGFPGNPMNGFFTNGLGGTGYFEPGLPVKSFGEFQGVGVGG